jgi:hypothetical protein
MGHRTFFNVNVALHLVIALVAGPVAFLVPSLFTGAENSLHGTATAVAASRSPVGALGIRLAGAAIVACGVVGSAFHLLLGPSSTGLAVSAAFSALWTVVAMLDYPASHRLADFLAVAFAGYCTLFYAYYLLAVREHIPVRLDK